MLKAVVLNNARKTSKALRFVNPLEVLPLLHKFCESQILVHVKLLDCSDLNAIVAQNTVDQKDLDKQRSEMTIWYEFHYKSTLEMDQKLLFLNGFYSVYDARDKYWYRARLSKFVNGVDDKDGIELQTLDYGTKILVPSKDYLYPLRNQDLELPIQVCTLELFDLSAEPKIWTDFDAIDIGKDLGWGQIKGIGACIMSKTKTGIDKQPWDHLSVVFLTDNTGEIIPYDFNGKIKLPKCSYQKFWI